MTVYKFVAPGKLVPLFPYLSPPFRGEFFPFFFEFSFELLLFVFVAHERCSQMSTLYLHIQCKHEFKILAPRADTAHAQI